MISRTPCVTPTPTPTPIPIDCNCYGYEFYVEQSGYVCYIPCDTNENVCEEYVSGETITLSCIKADSICIPSENNLGAVINILSQTEACGNWCILPTPTPTPTPTTPIDCNCYVYNFTVQTEGYVCYIPCGEDIGVCDYHLPSDTIFTTGCVNAPGPSNNPNITITSISMPCGTWCVPPTPTPTPTPSPTPEDCSCVQSFTYECTLESGCILSWQDCSGAFNGLGVEQGFGIINDSVDCIDKNTISGRGITLISVGPCCLLPCNCISFINNDAVPRTAYYDNCEGILNIEIEIPPFATFQKCGSNPTIEMGGLIEIGGPCIDGECVEYATPTPTPTNTVTPTITPTPTSTAIPVSVTPTSTPTPTPTPTPTSTPTSPLTCQTLTICSPTISGEEMTVGYIDCDDVFYTITVYAGTECQDICAKAFTIYNDGIDGTASFTSPTCLLI
jgi:hypothetical protein